MDQRELEKLQQAIELAKQQQADGDVRTLLARLEELRKGARQ